MAEKENNKGKPGEIEQRVLTFITCPKHGASYPKGSVCPQCDAESKR